MIKPAALQRLTEVKFANGAVTAAFAQAFNDGVHGKGQANEEPDTIFRDELESDYLAFDGDSLDWRNSYGEVLHTWPAVSGRPGAQSPRLQGAVGVGPIPEGTWSVRQTEYQSIADRPFHQAVLGRFGRGTWRGGWNSWGGRSNLAACRSRNTNIWSRRILDPRRTNSRLGWLR